MALPSRTSRLRDFATILVALTLAAACGTSSTPSPSPTASDGGANGSQSGAEAACDPADSSACGAGSTCVAHSTGNVPGCEKVPESELSLSLGCRSCVSASHCAVNGGTCTEGSCRNPLGYLFRVRAAVTADETLLAERCCPTGRIECAAPDGEGDRACKCVP